MRRDPNRLVWPPRLSDLFALLCAGVVVYALIQGAWVLAGFALVPATFAVAFPRMKGQWELRGGANPRARGELIEPVDEDHASVLSQF